MLLARLRRFSAARIDQPERRKQYCAWSISRLACRKFGGTALAALSGYAARRLGLGILMNTRGLAEPMRVTSDSTW